jgi:hypothetical protein
MLDDHYGGELLSSILDSLGQFENFYLAFELAM